MITADATIKSVTKTYLTALEWFKCVLQQNILYEKMNINGAKTNKFALMSQTEEN